MKKLAALTLALSVILSLAACGGQQTTTTQNSNSTTSTSNAQNTDKGGIVSALEEIVQPEKELSTFEKLFADGPILAQGENELWGYIDSTGAWVIEPKFTDKSRKFVDGYARVHDPETELYGLIQADGSWVAEPKYKYLDDFSEGLANAQDAETGNWGYIDTRSNWVIEPQYKKANPFHEGVAPVLPLLENLQDDETDGIGYIDHSGKLVIPYQYAEAGLFEGGRAIVTERSSYGFYMIDRDGNNLGMLPYDYIPFRADTVNFGNSTYAGWSYDWMILANKEFANTVSIDSYRGGGTGGLYWNNIDMSSFDSLVIDKNLNVVFDGFEHNCYVFRVLNNHGDLLVMDKTSRDYGIVNINGTWVIEPEYDSMRVFADHVFAGKATDKVNELGYQVYEDINIEIKGIGGDNPPSAELQSDEERALMLMGDKIQVDGVEKWGFVDQDRNQVIDYIYDSVGGFSPDDYGYSTAKFEGLWGIIGRDGNWLIQPQFLNIITY